MGDFTMSRETAEALRDALVVLATEAVGETNVGCAMAVAALERDLYPTLTVTSMGSGGAVSGTTRPTPAPTWTREPPTEPGDYRARPACGCVVRTECRWTLYAGGSVLYPLLLVCPKHGLIPEFHPVPITPPGEPRPHLEDAVTVKASGEG